VLIADTRRTLEIKQKLFDEHLLVTNINYPVVPKGKDEIRIQLSAPHSEEDIMRLAKSISKNL
jgi:glycine C-acetyltransferase